MGLFTALLTLPLAPLRGVVTVAEVLEREAYRQWTDPATVRAQLADVEAAFEAGELTEAERDALQDELVARHLASRAGDNR
jgi:hypothetical protein